MTGAIIPIEKGIYPDFSMAKNKTPDSEYGDSEKIPSSAYDLGRKDGWNSAIDFVTSALELLRKK